MIVKTLLAALVLFAGTVSPILAVSHADSCQQEDPFQLRDAVEHSKPSLLCTGVLAASEAKRKEAEHDLSAVIHANPHSADAYEAHDNLLWMFFTEGRFRKALRQLDQMMAEKPNQADTIAVHSLLASLGIYPDLSVTNL